MSLIKLVRTLDQTGPGVDGQNLRTLWEQLSASTASQFHAAEQSSLRWLLKSMNGPSQPAETLRRFPLTWMLLTTIFKRMPLFPLAKALADRRFVSVLQQTLHDLTQSDSGEKPVASLGKRKRTTSTQFDLDQLKTTVSRLDAAHALFQALQMLLSKLEPDSAASSHDKIGSEHIKSLFCTPAKDAIELARPLLSLSSLALNFEDVAGYDHLEDWIATISSIWDLHLQNEDDAMGVAAAISEHAAALMAHLEGFNGQLTCLPEPSKARWSNDLRSFLANTVVQPAKAQFLRDGSVEIIKLAINVTRESSQQTVPALYYLITSSQLNWAAQRRKEDVKWLKENFRIFEEAIRQRPNNVDLVEILLKRASDRSMPVDVDHLSSICRNYALKDSDTNWTIISLAVSCDPDIFQIGKLAKELITEVCDRMLATPTQSADKAHALDIIVDGIRKGYETSRNISGFLKLWYDQMSRTPEDVLSQRQSPWFRLGARSRISFDGGIERYLSISQFQDILESIFAESRERPKHDALAVFLEATSQGIQSDSFTDATSDVFFNMSSLLISSKSSFSPLRWRTIARAMGWYTGDKKAAAWSNIKKPLAKTLKKDDIESSNCFEAFKCCCQAWLSMTPDGDYISEISKILEDFSKRMKSSMAEKGSALAQNEDLLEQYVEYDVLEGPTIEHYVVWCANGISGLAHLTLGETRELPFVPSLAVQATGEQPGAAQDLWELMLQNDQTWQGASFTTELVDRLITVLDEVRKAKSWPGSAGRRWLGLFARVPSDALQRQQRERAMVVLSAYSSGLSKRAKHVEKEDWISYLTIVSKIMLQPTFYDGMEFGDLLSTGDVLSTFITDKCTRDEECIEFIDRFHGLATAVLSQMIDNVDERSLKYFSGATELLEALESAETENAEALKSLEKFPLRFTLLRSMATQLEISPGCSANTDLVQLPGRIRDVLKGRVTSLIEAWSADKKLFFEGHLQNGLLLYTTVDALQVLDPGSTFVGLKIAKAQQLDQRSSESMRNGDLRGWVVQTLLRTRMPQAVGEVLPSVMPDLNNVSRRLRATVVEDFVKAVTGRLDAKGSVAYLHSLLDSWDSDSLRHAGQLSAIQSVVRGLIGESRCAISSLCVSTNFS